MMLTNFHFFMDEFTPDYPGAGIYDTTDAPKHGKNWFGTLNNYVREDIDALLVTKVKYLIVCEEVGPKNGVSHLHAVLCFDQTKSLKSLKTLLGPRWNLCVCRSTDASIKYCKKDGKFQEVGNAPILPAAKGQMEKDRWSVALAATEVGVYDEVDPQIRLQFCRQLEWLENKAKLAQAPSTTSCAMLWFYGSANTGKSHAARADFPGAFIKQHNKWWDGYTNQRFVILDDVEPGFCSSNASLFKMWADKYDFPAEVKGGSMKIRPEVIVVTSNYTILECFRDADLKPILRRFNQYDFAGGKGKRKLSWNRDNFEDIYGVRADLPQGLKDMHNAASIDAQEAACRALIERRYSVSVTDAPMEPAVEPPVDSPVESSQLSTQELLDEVDLAASAHALVALRLQRQNAIHPCTPVAPRNSPEEVPAAPRKRLMVDLTAESSEEEEYIESSEEE
ncbi:MAG: helicase [Cressdnaviricota sp.]|nr:MAG: helicase [Cressdnaviricota sp.]